jgi:hypothetical protein
MARFIACTLAVLLLVTSGVVHGLYSGRWSTTAELDAGIARVPTVPMEFDGWKAELGESNADEFAQAGAIAYWTRKYRKDGNEVLAILMVGRAGRMAVHTPEVCYAGAGYGLVGQPSPYLLKGAGDKELGTFWTASFKKPGPSGSDLQLYWGWNDGAGWKAPDNPLWTYSGRPVLYKLYLSQQVVGMTGPTATNLMDDFLRSFVPVLDATLGESSAKDDVMRVGPGSPAT